MFFIRVGSVVAWLLVITGGIQTVLGFIVAFGFSVENNAAASRRYLAAASSGEAINEGTIVCLSGLILGLLVIIAKKHI